MIKPELVVQQRVFIGNMQRFNMVEISASTTAGDIIEMIKAEGTFKDFASSDGWMVFEAGQLALDFGLGTLFFSLSFLHRCVTICLVYAFALKAIPSSSPTSPGYTDSNDSTSLSVWYTVSFSFF